MYTYRDVVFMVADYLKIMSDDSYYTPEHIKFLLDKFRAYVLKSKYEKGNDIPTDSNYQTLKIELEEVDRIEGFSCRGKYLKSKNKIPDSLGIGAPTFSGADIFNGDMSIVSSQRFRYVGFNKWMKNITYVTFEGGYVYIKSCNPFAYHLQEGIYRDIFVDPLEAAALSGDYQVDSNGKLCDEFEIEYPLEDNLLPLVMQYVVKELVGSAYKPKDNENNAQDDLSELARFIRTYVKNPLRRQIEE